MSDRMTIGQVAQASGVSAKMIRHYESLGLLPAPRRTEAGYRLYDEPAIHQLRFIRQARELGFSLRQIEELLALWLDRQRASSKVKQLALEHIALLEQKIAELEQMKATLSRLASSCHGDARPECPILEELAAGPGAQGCDCHPDD